MYDGLGQSTWLMESEGGLPNDKDWQHLNITDEGATFDTGTYQTCIQVEKFPEQRAPFLHLFWDDLGFSPVPI